MAGLLTLNPWLLADGFFNVCRGVIELVTTPLTWFLKPFTRGVATFVHGGYKKIEENSGMHDLAQYGHEYLAQSEIELNSDETIYELFAICNDLHRKFDKSVTRGQPSTLEVEEYSSYSEIRADNILDPQKLSHYFSLFTPKYEQSENKPDLTSEVRFS